MRPPKLDTAALFRAFTLPACMLALAACGETLAGGPGGDDAATDVRASKASGDAGARTSRDAGAADGSRSPDAARGDARSDAHEVTTRDAASDTAIEAEAQAPRNHGDASSVYPAFPPDIPQVQYQGGPTLRAPEVVTITWPGEENAQALESFGDDIGLGVYWSDTTAEYNVGMATSGPQDHVRLTEQPIVSWSDSALVTWLSDHVANYAQYGMPAPNPNSIYTLYLSTATALSLQGSDACQSGVGGYHDSFVLNGQDVTYAVILQCNGDSLQQATSSASHELIEASTDPHPSDIPGYETFDNAHFAWHVFGGLQADEVADACEIYYGPTGSFYTQAFPVFDPADAGVDGGGLALLDGGLTSYNVQRSWSNANAAAGHAPCVPAVAGPYYAVAPLEMENITLNLTQLGGPSSVQTLGYRIAKGATKTFGVGFHSDAPTSGPWTISVVEGSPMMGGVSTPHVTTSIDVPTGVNGDISYITVTVTAVDPTMNGELLTIVSRLGTGMRTYVPLLISNE